MSLSVKLLECLSFLKKWHIISLFSPYRFLSIYWQIFVLPCTHKCLGRYKFMKWNKIIKSIHWQYFLYKLLQHVVTCSAWYYISNQEATYLNNNGPMIQVWTQKCAVKKQVWMSIFHIINFKKKKSWTQGSWIF